MEYTTTTDPVTEDWQRHYRCKPPATVAETIYHATDSYNEFWCLAASLEYATKAGRFGRVMTHYDKLANYPYGPNLGGPYDPDDGDW